MEAASVSHLPHSINVPPLRIASPPLLQDGQTSTSLAAHKGHLEALRTLLAANTDPVTSGKVRRGRRGHLVLKRGE